MCETAELGVRTLANAINTVALFRLRATAAKLKNAATHALRILSANTTTIGVVDYAFPGSEHANLLIFATALRTSSSLCNARFWTVRHWRGATQNDECEEERCDTTKMHLALLRDLTAQRAIYNEQVEGQLLARAGPVVRVTLGAQELSSPPP